VSRLERALLTLDAGTVGRVEPALAWMRSQGVGDEDPDVELLRRFLWRQLPIAPSADDREPHEVAWALGELFEQAALAQGAALCRAATTHEIIAVGRWTRSFPHVPAQFWRPALAGLGPRPEPPQRVRLTLAGVRALLEAVGDGLELTADGRLPAATVQALDDRFRWTDEFPWMRATAEEDIPPLRFLHEHLTAQRLLVRDGGLARVGETGRAALADTAGLWRAVVDPAPRWTHEFDRDVLGVMAAALLRTGSFSAGRMTEEVTHVLAAKWRPARPDQQGSVFDGASLVVQEWYRLGVPLGWWDTGRGPADRHPNVFGAAAAAAVFRAAPTAPAGGRPA
jgi:hypothetical protein